MPDYSAPRAGDVLVIDDDPVIVDLVIEVLTEEGYAVRGASNGLEGLRAIAAAPPALLLLDIQMPGMCGVELATRVRAAGHDFPIVTITATPKLAEALMNLHSVEYLAKPFDLELLIAGVARYVMPAGVPDPHT